jgi:hypothetical protein
MQGSDLTVAGTPALNQLNPPEQLGNFHAHAVPATGHDTSRSAQGVEANETLIRLKQSGANRDSVSDENSPRENDMRDPVGDARQRVRKTRVLVNVGRLGEINHVEQRDLFEIVAEINMLEHGDDEILYELNNYKEAKASPQAGEWSKGRKAEKRSLNKRKTMLLCKISAGAKLLRSRYVYKIKRDLVGNVKQFKVRLVVLGCQKQKGVDVEQTFAPVVKGVTVRLIMALAFIMNMVIHQIDISSAFCYADLEEDVYMKPPPDVQVPDGWCFKLLKSLYGLRASPRNWNKHIDKYIKSLLNIFCY